MIGKFIDRTEKYDGSQLVSLRSYLKHKILGDSIVAWIGPCDIPFEHMVDGEDLNAGAAIRGDRMVHFIIEKFDSSLLAAVGLQRLLASVVKDYLAVAVKDRALADGLYRVGDDIYVRQIALAQSIQNGRAGAGAKERTARGGSKIAKSASNAGKVKSSKGGDPKLSISIATQSPVSSLIHFAVNVTNKGTPVNTLSLDDLSVEPKKFAADIVKRFAAECADIKEATMKVRWVK